MKKTLLLISLIAVFILSACSAPAPGAQSVQQQPEPTPVYVEGRDRVRTIMVNGSGQVTMSPDLAYISIGVQTQSENVAEALNQNSANAQEVSNSLQQLGVAEADIQTSSFNIYPQQQYNQQGEITGTIFVVNNTVYVTVRDLQVMGRLLDTVVRSGANSINGISFDVQDKSQAISEARRLAVESARSQAAEMAQAAGVTLGALENMSVYTSSPVQPMYEGRGGFAADASQVPISAGQLVIRVEVGATYAIH
jgi:uncharacterized protein